MFHFTLHVQDWSFDQIDSCYNSAPHTQTHKRSLWHIIWFANLSVYFQLPHVQHLSDFSSLTSFIKWLSRLVDDLRRSIIALYHHLYWWHFAWLYVFLMATLGEIEWNDIWNSGRARRFILQQAFVYSCYRHTESTGRLWGRPKCFSWHRDTLSGSVLIAGW